MSFCQTLHTEPVSLNVRLALHYAQINMLEIQGIITENPL